MIAEYKDFIGVFSDVYPEGFCQHIIEEFDRNRDLGAGSNRQTSENAEKHSKDDYQIGVNGRNSILEPYGDHDTRDFFFRGLQNCYEEYSNEFSCLRNSEIICNNIKIQKTSSGGGYHIWHGEQGNGDQARRGLVYMLYLNTLPPSANGETEFLYQQRRIAPVENTMLIWPAAFTHAHRGNPVYGDNHKYIVTGWFVYE